MRHVALLLTLVYHPLGLWAPQMAVEQHRSFHKAEGRKQRRHRERSVRPVRRSHRFVPPRVRLT